MQVLAEKIKTVITSIALMRLHRCYAHLHLLYDNHKTDSNDHAVALRDREHHVGLFNVVESEEG